MFCVNCGVEILKEAKFCAGCGAKIQMETGDDAESNFTQLIEDQNPKWFRAAINELIESVAIDSLSSIGSKTNIKKFSAESCLLSDDEFLSLIFLQTGELSGRESINFGRELTDSLTQRLLSYLDCSDYKKYHSKLLDSVFNIVVYINGRQIYSTGWEEEDSDEDEDDAENKSDDESSVNLDESVLVSYADRIIEKNILSDLISASSYDLLLGLENYEIDQYKLVVNLDIDDSCDLDEEQREGVGDVVFDYLRERGAFDEMGVDPECVDWIVVLVNNS